MFRRRNPLPPIEKLRCWVWPKRGWTRGGQYIMHRLSRLPGSGYSIACGFAFGSAISFTPFVGLHLIFGGALAWICGGNVLAAWIGTLVGNPWTFPFIWLGLYKLGNWMLQIEGPEGEAPPNFTDVFAQLWEALLSLDFASFADGIAAVIVPMTVAGIPCFIVAWVVSYFPMKYLVDSYKNKRMKRLRKKKRQELAAANAAGQGVIP